MELHHRSDIITLVNKFYEKVKRDELLAPVFAHVRLAGTSANYV